MVLSDELALSADTFDRNIQLRFEFARRTGFAVAEINEAMGLLEDAIKNDARYWAMKALIRAKDMLETGEPS